MDGGHGAVRAGEAEESVVKVRHPQLTIGNLDRIALTPPQGWSSLCAHSNHSNKQYKGAI